MISAKRYGLLEVRAMRATDLRIVTIAQLFIIGFSGAVSASGESTFDRRTPVVKVYQDTHEAVVNIAGERLVSSSIWPGYEWPDMFDMWGPRYQRQIAVLGSGMVVHEDGYVITNAHVIKDSEKIKVVFSDGSEYMAKVVSDDESMDLAVLKIPVDKKMPFIRLGQSNDLMIGETVVAIGNPYGYANTVTSGVVSAIGRDIQIAEGYWLRGLILQINNATVRNVRELSLEMEKINEGDSVDVKIMRISVGIFGQVQQRYAARLNAQSKKSGRFLF
jgi:S1-C subfamily serine protease